MLAIDIETTALEPEDGEIRLIQLSDGKRVIVYDVRDKPNYTLTSLTGVDELAAHNAPFEARWLGRDNLPELHDTLVMSRVLYGGTNHAHNKRFTHGLASVVKRELGVDLSKDEQTSDWSDPNLTQDQIMYAARDALYTAQVADRLLRKIDEAGLRKVYELERRVAHAVDAMERNGFAVNEEALQAFIDRTAARANELKAKLEAEWGINPGSSKQLIEHFDLEIIHGWPRTAGGAPSTNQEAMQGLANTVPSVEKWLEWKKVEKLRSTYGTSLQHVSQ
jgi:DNA polymerase-1